MNLPFSQACENNKGFIVEVLASYFNTSDLNADNNAKPLTTTIWEFGSGTGQHAVYFSEQLPHVIWQPTDLAGPYFEACCQRVSQSGNTDNLKSPKTLNATHKPWPCASIQNGYTANTLHIMSWKSVEAFFRNLGEYLQANGLFFCYGPLNYNGAFTSQSNAEFDIWLKERDHLSGIRDFEVLTKLAQNNRLTLLEDLPMPANNRLLIWKKQSN